MMIGFVALPALDSIKMLTLSLPAPCTKVRVHESICAGESSELLASWGVISWLIKKMLYLGVGGAVPFVIFELFGI